MKDIQSRIASYIESFLTSLGYFVVMFCQVVVSICTRFPRKELILSQLYEIGVRSLLLVCSTGMATGMVLAAQSFFQLSDKGLTALAEGANSMLIEMARVLTGDQADVNVSDSWKGYKRKELESDSFMGDDVLEAEVSTTTFINSDHSTNITYNRIVRGKIFPKNGYAVAIVDKYQFLFRAGRILFNGKPCGNYDKKGMGTINNKTIQIMKAEQSETDCYVLVEIR